MAADCARAAPGAAIAAAITERTCLRSMIMAASHQGARRMLASMRVHMLAQIRRDGKIGQKLPLAPQEAGRSQRRTSGTFHIEAGLSGKAFTSPWRQP